MQMSQPLKKIMRRLGYKTTPHPPPSHPQSLLAFYSGIATPAFCHTSQAYRPTRLPFCHTFARAVQVIVLLSLNLKLVTFLTKYYYFARGFNEACKIN